MTWIECASLGAGGRYGATLCAVGQFLFLVGGWTLMNNRSVYLNDVLRYDTKQQTPWLLSHFSGIILLFLFLCLFFSFFFFFLFFSFYDEIDFLLVL